MQKEELYQLSFQLILHSGNARSCAMEAISLQKQGDTSGASEKLNEADQEFNEAHKIQTQLIQAEASGEELELPIILIHAQDHLMTAMTTKDLAKEIIELYQKIS